MPRAGRDLLNFSGKRTSSGNANIGLRKDGTNGYTAGNIMTLLQDRDNIVKIPKVKKAEMKKLIDEVLRKKGNVTVNQAVIEIRKLL